jgi:hypothetical protein
MKHIIILYQHLFEFFKFLISCKNWFLFENMFSFFLVTLIMTCTLLLVLGFFSQKTEHQQLFINPKINDKRQVVHCLDNPVECTTDNECNHMCQESKQFSFACQPSTKNGLKKFCLPKKPEQPCPEKNGGVWTWSGWDSRPGDWSCLCTLPEFFGSSGCTKLNPNVCRNGKFSFDATLQNRYPNMSDCQCAEGFAKIVNRQGVPTCVKLDSELCKTQKICEKNYS